MANNLESRQYLLTYLLEKFLRSRLVEFFPDLSFNASFSDSSVSIDSWAFSTRLRISPIPKIRSANLVASNNSSPSSFSEFPTNRTGHP